MLASFCIVPVQSASVALTATDNSSGKWIERSWHCSLLLLLERDPTTCCYCFCNQPEWRAESNHSVSCSFSCNSIRIGGCWRFWGATTIAALSVVDGELISKSVEVPGYESTVQLEVAPVDD
jgi:hypothetical protein